MAIAAVPVLMHIPPFLDKNSLSSVSSPTSVAIRLLNNSHPEGRRWDLSVLLNWISLMAIRILYVYWTFVLSFVRTVSSIYPLFSRSLNFAVILLSSLYFKTSISVRCVFGKAFPPCYKLSPPNGFLCQTDVFLISCDPICSFLEFFLELL